MKKHTRCRISRLNFVKGSLAVLALSAVPDITIAGTPPRKQLPPIDYSKAIILKNCTIRSYDWM
ncbi:MAG: hypothetical protein QMD11_08740 [Smithella sp.]|nr:hypothetical protein [Smithella sp.]